jgi:hypothetical protein
MEVVLSDDAIKHSSLAKCSTDHQCLILFLLTSVKGLFFSGSLGMGKANTNPPVEQNLQKHPDLVAMLSDMVPTYSRKLLEAESEPEGPRRILQRDRDRSIGCSQNTSNRCHRYIRKISTFTSLRSFEVQTSNHEITQGLSPRVTERVSLKKNVHISWCPINKNNS